MRLLFGSPGNPRSNVNEVLNRVILFKTGFNHYILFEFDINYNSNMKDENCFPKNIY